MNREIRQEICEALLQLGDRHPDMRFGQLVEMVALLASNDAPLTAYDVDDDEFLAALRRHSSTDDAAERLIPAELDAP